MKLKSGAKGDVNERTDKNNAIQYVKTKVTIEQREKVVISECKLGHS